jgi:mannose-1-phosphate guanylyltransferase
MEELYALVMAGGRGTRFWPVSRRSHPKQCISFAGRAALLEQTVQRLLPLIPIERILVGTGRDMEASVRAVLPDLPQENLLVEPWGRNTAPCIGWGAVEVGRRCQGAVMAVFPSDHVIANADAFRIAVADAAKAAKATNSFVTLGITPTRPETGFGYLAVGPEVGTWGSSTFKTVSRFVEKPDPDTAAAFLEGGQHLWNAGMFVFSVDGLRDAFRTHLPRSAEALERISQNPSLLEEEWGNLDATSVDYGIMERSRHILTVPCELGWSDVGTWTAAAAEMPVVPGGRGIARAVVSRDSRSCVVHAPGKVVVLIGLKDVVVVDTPDALLVMDAARAQQVGDVVRTLEDGDLKELT